MDVSTARQTKQQIHRGMLPTLCVLAAVSAAPGDDLPLNRLRSERETRTRAVASEKSRDTATPRQQATDSKPDLERFRVKIGPEQKLRAARFRELPSQPLETISRATHERDVVAEHPESAQGEVRQASSKQPSRQAVVPTSYQTGVQCDGVCDVVVEPVCGVEPGCGCDVCVETYGPTCGVEATCGIEASCGIDAPLRCVEPCGGIRADPRLGWLGRYHGPRNLSIRGEYLLWWVEGFNVPPLLTTSSPGTSVEDAGVLGLPTTSVLVGNERQPDDLRSGGRVTLNYWFDSCQSCGIEASYFGLGKERARLTADSSQFPILARPFFNVEPGVAEQDSELIAFPGQLEGNSLVEAESRLQGIEVLYRQAAFKGCGFRLDGLVGWRNNRLDEDLRFSDFKRITSDDFGLPIGTTLAEAGSFETSNVFHGAEIGVIAEACRCGWTLECLMKLALGNNHSEVGIDGSAVFTQPGNPPTVTRTPAGLLALPSNIGVHQRDDFAVIPELGVTLGYELSCHWRATVGYTFMYWSRVARPGDQIDLDLNLTQLDDTGLVGQARPQPTGLLTDLWAQGVNFGLEARF